MQSLSRRPFRKLNSLGSLKGSLNAPPWLEVRKALEEAFHVIGSDEQDVELFFRPGIDGDRAENEESKK